jgi:hypothetical protein
MELAVCSAVINLSFLMACPLAFAGSQHGVSIKVFTSTDDQFWTNSVMIPGHSKVGAPLDASTAVAFTETYLLACEEELTKAKDPDSLIKAMKERFPSADLLLAIERGATANVKP